MAGKQGRALATSTGQLEPMWSARPGEGVAVQVGASVEKIEGNVKTFSFSLDLGKAAVPSRRFYADAVQVLKDSHCVHLCFGQRKLFGPGRELGQLRALLDVVMQFDSCGQFLTSLKAHVFTVPSGQLSVFTDEPDQTVPLNVSFVATSMGPEETCLDFYHGSPFEFSNIALGQSVMHVDPIVRVLLPSPLFRGLVEELRSREDIAAALPRKEV